MKNISTIAGAVALLTLSGAAFAHGYVQGKEGVPSYLAETVAKFPAKDATHFRDTMKEAHDKNMALADKVHELHDELDTIMASEPFDKDAFVDKSGKLREIYEKMRENTDEAFASAAAELTQSERKTLATAMTYPHEKHTAKNAQ